MIEEAPLHALSQFLYLLGALLIPVSWALCTFYKHRCERAYDREVEATPEEILEELDREFTPCRQTTIRTQTEYLPYVFECIRQHIDSGFEDLQMASLLQRIEQHRPDQERSAMFTVMSGRQRSDLHMHWVRDSCDRILLHIRGAPSVIRALKDQKRKIPRALA